MFLQILKYSLTNVKLKRILLFTKNFKMTIDILWQKKWSIRICYVIQSSKNIIPTLVIQAVPGSYEYLNEKHVSNNNPISKIIKWINN